MPQLARAASFRVPFAKVTFGRAFKITRRPAYETKPGQIGDIEARVRSKYVLTFRRR